MGAMSLPILIVPAAEADLLEAIAWYESNYSDLSFDFRLSLDAALDHIARYPEACALVAPAVRRALLHRFPHAVYYRHQKTSIEVIAILHTRRNPRVWQKGRQ
jgi:plasmid stabilization system protein ParE